MGKYRNLWPESVIVKDYMYVKSLQVQQTSCTWWIDSIFESFANEIKVGSKITTSKIYYEFILLWIYFPMLMAMSSVFLQILLNENYCLGC